MNSKAFCGGQYLIFMGKTVTTYLIDRYDKGY